jgi:hypothetical protein
MKILTRTPYFLGFLFAGVAGAGVSACDAQQPPDYMGDALITLHGLVEDGRTQAPPAAKVVVIWGDVGAMFAPWGAAVNLTGSFPEAFQLELFDPPAQDRLYLPTIAFPDGYYDPALESRIAIARIVAVKQGVDPTTFIPSEDVIGGAEDRTVVYVEHDIAAGTAGAAYFGGPVSAGYHVANIATSDDANATSMPIKICQSQATDPTAWKACGSYSTLSIAPGDATIGVRLVDNETELMFRWAGPSYLTPGVPTTPPTCTPPTMPGQMPTCM